MRSAASLYLAICLVVVGAPCTNLVFGSQVGLWQFNGNFNNEKPGGTAMTVEGGWIPNFVSETIGGSPASVLSFPAFGDTESLNMPNQAGTNGGGGVETNNNWSIVMDVKFPSLAGFVGLWETNELASGDGDYFLNNGSLGIAGQYSGFVNENTWTRIAVTVDSVSTPGTYTLNAYVDGVFAGTATEGTPPAGRESVKSVLHLFADDDFETAAGLVNSVAYYGQSLSASAIEALGGPAATGVPAAAGQAGLWNFNDNLNNSVSGGAPMAAAGGWSPAYVNETIGGSAARVLSFPAMSDTQALDMPNEASPDDVGVPTNTNIWSIVMDVKFPTLNSFTALYNTDSPLDSDGEYFIRDDSAAGTSGGIGISGQYNGVLEADKWTRVAVTVDGSNSGGPYIVTGYIDGVLAGSANTSNAPNGRQAIDAFLKLFSDDDFETAAGLVNSVAYYDELLTPEQIATLGGASAAGIPAAVGLPGDYNESGEVDAADYTKWRDNLGAAIALPNEGVTPGMVTPEDYTFWKTQFGNGGAGSGAGFGTAAVPEPAGLCLMALALGLSSTLIRSRRTHAARSVLVCMHFSEL